MKRYLIIAELRQEEQYKLPSVLIRDIGPGRKEYHCTLPRGAFSLILNKGKSERPNWKVLAIFEIDQTEYLKALETYVHSSQ